MGSFTLLQIKRQEELLQKCKESIRNYKEKVVQLAAEKQELLVKLEQKVTWMIWLQYKFIYLLFDFFLN